MKLFTVMACMGVLFASGIVRAEERHNNVRRLEVNCEFRRHGGGATEPSDERREIKANAIICVRGGHDVVIEDSRWGCREWLALFLNRDDRPSREKELIYASPADSQFDGRRLRIVGLTSPNPTIKFEHHDAFTSDEHEIRAELRFEGKELEGRCRIERGEQH